MSFTLASKNEHPFEIIACDKVPQESGDPKAIGRHLEEDTPTASTRGICSAADFRAATMPS